MSNRSRRAQRIDYKKFSETGERVPLDTEPEEALVDNRGGESSGGCNSASGAGASIHEPSIERSSVTRVETTLICEPSVDRSSESRGGVSPLDCNPGRESCWIPRITVQDQSDSDESQPSSEVSSDSEDRTLVFEEGKVVDGLSANFRQLSFLSSSKDDITPTVKMSDNLEFERLLSLEESLYDDIKDYIDENPVADLLTIDDVNSFVVKLEGLRSKYRNVHKEIKRFQGNEEYDKAHLNTLNETLQIIKAELAEAKRTKNDLRNDELDAVAATRYRQQTKEREEVEKKENSINFLFVELDRLRKEVLDDISLTKISTDRDLVTDDDLVEMKKQFPTIQQKVNHFSDKYNELLKLVPDQVGQRKTALDTFADYYIKMRDDYITYQKHLHAEIHSREISKEKRFQTSSLSITLPKFKGYDSTHDFYTFKDKFEKLHLQDTPERALPELLKNNYLEGPALESVKRLQTMEEIWDNLKRSFGDPRVMLQRKLGELESIGCVSRVRDAEKTKDNLNKVVNVMEDLMRIAADHGVEGRLYYGDGIYQIYRIIGDHKTTKFIEDHCDERLEGIDLWKQLLRTLEKDIKVQVEKAMIFRALPEKSSASKDNDRKDKRTHLATADHSGDSNLASTSFAVPPPSPQGPNNANKSDKTCHLCGKDDHIATKGPYGKKFIQYFSCKDFVEASCSQRFAELRKRGFCTQCLFPGASAAQGKHAEGKCQSTYVCRHSSHSTFVSKKHVLVCEEHKEEDSNKALMEEYRARCITRKCNSELPDYSKSIQLSHYCAFQVVQITTDNERDPGVGIYMFQQIYVNDEIFTIFFDNGCGDCVATFDAITRLKKNATQVYDGMVALGVVGGLQVESKHGAYTISLPLHNGENAIITGLVIDQITNDFPTYQLEDVERDLHDAYRTSSGDVKSLPRLPSSVGGQVDIMIGVQFLRYFPMEVFRNWAGLTMYTSPFRSTDGSRGVVAGPHPSFRTANENFYGFTQPTAFFTLQAQAIRNNDIHERFAIKNYQGQLTHEEQENPSHDYIECTCAFVSRNKKFFDEAETAGSEISYRCVKCRVCQDCKSGERIETISLKEEVEQDVINHSVHVDLEAGKTTAALPFVVDPVEHLKPNRDEATLVYKTQLRKLSKDPQAKADVIASENQLQQLGFVDYVKNLTDTQRQKLFSNALQYFIPWRAVWNDNSISTVCRVVFDASMPTKSGKSLNDVLAKGRNQMNKLVEIVLRWFMRRVGFHTDVKKMYNSVGLHEEDWCYQMYLWQDELDPQIEPEPKVIKTIIYGVKPSGNQAERGLRETARLQKEEYPRAYQVATEDVYVDDCASGEDNNDLALKTANDLEVVLRNGGYNLKGFTFSGKPPPEHLTRDGKSINVVGMKWFSEEDLIQLDVGELNFAAKQRGRKPATEDAKQIPLILTRKHCAAKVAEIFDIAGKVTPITAGMKLDLRDFVDRGVQWKDQIPDDLRPIWVSHFEMMQEIPTLQYHRTVIPEDAVSLDIETIDTGDASKDIACIAIYARVKRKNGEYSCQLVFARSKLLERGTTQPRAELIAAMLNAHTGEVVRRAFGSYHQGSIKLCDSQIVLHWINNEQKALKQFVRSRVIEILRFTERATWYFIESTLMIADLGTRRGVKLADVDMNSSWFNGYEWMRKDKSTFPITAVNDLVLCNSDRDSYQKELFAPYQRDQDFQWPQTYICHPGSLAFISNRFSETSITKRYEFSQYIVDPNRHYFSSVVNIVAYVMRFIRYCRMKVQLTKGDINVEEFPGCTDGQPPTKEMVGDASLHILLSESEISAARQYFFRKATEEVLHFAKKNDYDKISKMTDGILYYTGRILPTQKIEAGDAITFTDAMKDLSSTTFCVPIIDSHSPIAYSVLNDIHWNHPVANHRGVETVYRYVLRECYILDGRNLVKMFRKNCERCRYLAKRTIEVEMGPVSGQNLTIAPAFYITQVDIAGPFKCYSSHNKRAKTNVYFLVFCCSTTSSVSIKIMGDYSAKSFLLAFSRFGCEVGFPKILVSDKGSQLLKGYEDMRISFTDIRKKLHSRHRVEFDLVPIGGHNMTGKVERKIQEIKKSIAKTYAKEELSELQWETAAAEIANTVNDLPLALGNIVSDFEEMDLLTPNRLRMGRNNNRSPVGPLFVTNDPSKIFTENTNIFNAWFETWLTSHVPKLMAQPKWFTTKHHIKEGDVVLFLKKEGLLNSTYQYGIVVEVKKARDGIVRKVKLRYRNHHEGVDRETDRATTQVVVIHKVEELNIIQELGQIATMVDMKKRCAELSATPAAGV